MLLSHVLTLILGSYIIKLLHVKIYKETQIRVRGLGSGQVGGVLSLTSVLGVYIVPQASVKTVRVWISESTHQAYATAPSHLSDLRHHAGQFVRPSIANPGECHIVLGPGSPL